MITPLGDFATNSWNELHNVLLMGHAPQRREVGKSDHRTLQDWWQGFNNGEVAGSN
jgi:hypothetical protein